MKKKKFSKDSLHAFTLYKITLHLTLKSQARAFTQSRISVHARLQNRQLYLIHFK